MPSSNSWRFTAFSIADTVIITSVAVTFAREGKAASGAIFLDALGVLLDGAHQHVLYVGIAESRSPC